MREFWVSSGHHLTPRTEGGGLAVTDELLLAYLARPELAPPPEACAAERALHASLLREPRRPVAPAEVEALAGHILERFGAPDRNAARAAAREEVDFAASLCDHPVNTIIAMHRRLEGNEIREQFRTLQPRDTGTDRLHAHARAFTFVEAEEEPAEEVDLLGLLETKRP